METIYVIIGCYTFLFYSHTPVKSAIKRLIQPNVTKSVLNRQARRLTCELSDRKLTLELPKMMSYVRCVLHSDFGCRIQTLSLRMRLNTTNLFPPLAAIL